MEVSSIWDLFFYIAMNIPMYATLSLLTWKLSPAGGANYTALLSDIAAIGIHIGIWILFFYNVYKIVHVNEEHLQKPVPEIHKYKFKQVAILDLAYMIAFGSELAVVSMLPMFFYETFHESQGVTMVQAGLLGGSFAFINLVARPLGGWLSDHFGRKLILTVCTAGMAAGYFMMSRINPDWPIVLVVSVKHGLSLLCVRRLRRGIRHRATDQTEDDRPDRRHGGCLWQCRWRVVFDDFIFCCSLRIFPSHARRGYFGLVGCALHRRTQRPYG